MSCPICQDTGFKPAENSRRVVRCECQNAARGQHLLEAARIPRRYEHCDFESYMPMHLSQGTAKMLAMRFVEEYPMQKAGLLFLGTVGTGKTHLAVSIIKALMQSKGIRCLFVDYRELLKEIQNSYNPTVNVTELEVLEPVINAEVLVLDELGAVKPTEWVWDTVSLILNTRYNEQRTTILTTNYPDLAPGASREQTLGDRITERMRSRLYEMCRKIELQGEDFRQRVKSVSFR